MLIMPSNVKDFQQVERTNLVPKHAASPQSTELFSQAVPVIRTCIQRGQQVLISKDKTQEFHLRLQMYSPHGRTNLAGGVLTLAKAGSLHVL